MNNEPKQCSKCHETKPLSMFYICKGKHRSDCKACAIKLNVRYQKRIKYWLNRYVDKDTSRPYMIEYYNNHKEKFAEYRRNFKLKNPDYYKEYARNKKLRPL